MNDARFLLGYIARLPGVTAAEALALAATDPRLSVAQRALAAETALDVRQPPELELIPATDDEGNYSPAFLSALRGEEYRP